MLNIPIHITLVFIATAATGVVFLILALQRGTERTKKRTTLVGLVAILWLLFQSTLALNKWYMDTRSKPPHLIFPVAASVAAMILLFATPRGRSFIKGLSLEILCLLHIIRIPVEYCLYALAHEGRVPNSMTFEGRNFDIVFGLTAPVMWWLLKRSHTPIFNRIFLGWNVLGLLSVLQVAVTGILSLPPKTNLLNTDVPNTAVMYFPFIWLPAFLVPLVVFSHVTTIQRKLFGN
jgi:hypothetical protein